MNARPTSPSEAEGERRREGDVSGDRLFGADRPFQLWFYTVSHSCLLLRANPRSKGDTRIDLLFKPVDYLELPHRMPSLVVHETSLEDWPEGHGVRRADIVGRLYRLTWPNGTGCIVAGTFAWHEDDGDYATPSHFDGAFLPGRGP